MHNIKWIPKAVTKEYGTVYLDEYTARTRQECEYKILSKAREEKFVGGIERRLQQLGWEIVKVKLVEIEE